MWLSAQYFEKASLLFNDDDNDDDDNDDDDNEDYGYNDGGDNKEYNNKDIGLLAMFRFSFLRPPSIHAKVALKS